MLAAPIADARVLRGAAATISVTIRDQNGEPVAAVGTVTVNVTRGDGTAVVTGGTTTTTKTGVYTASLTATQTGLLDLFTCDWKDGSTVRATTYVEVVGGFFFSIADVRGFDRSLESEAKYPDEVILAARREVEDECERITECAWVPRYRRAQIVSGVSRHLLRVPDTELRTVRSIRYYSAPAVYTQLTAPELAAISFDRDTLYMVGTGYPWGQQDIVVEYEHGRDRPPTDLRHACLTRLRTTLNRENSGIPTEATQMTTPGGGASYQLGALPREVDATYQRWSMRIPGCA